jgi:hypothetical protein
LKFLIILLNQEPKSSGKDVNGSASKSNAPQKGTPPPSSNAGSSNSASGPVTEQEIRTVLMQRTPLTTQELVAKFKGRLRCAEVSSNFSHPCLNSLILNQHLVKFRYGEKDPHNNNCHIMLFPTN